MALARTHPPTATLQAVRSIGPALAARALEIEDARTLPRDVVEQLVDNGIFRMWVPASLGGSELEPSVALSILEELSYWDASCGWCAMIGFTTSLLAAHLPTQAALEIYGSDPRAITGGVVAPKGTAVRAEGGLVVSGQWPWGSGARHSHWIGGGCRLQEDGEPVRVLFVFFEREQVDIEDNWHAAGLRGSGSSDFRVEEAFVPEGRWVSMPVGSPRIAGPLYDLPLFSMLALGVNAVGLGIARRSISELKALAVEKRYAIDRNPMAERVDVQTRVAEAEAALGAANAFVNETLARAWESAKGSGVTLEQQARLRSAVIFATEQATQAVDLMYEAGGGTSVYRSSPLQRCFRDMHVVTQHHQVTRRNYELLGRLSLGLPSDTTRL